MHVSRTEVVALIPSLLLPFNLIKGVLNAAMVLLLYKPLSRTLKKSRFLQIEAGNAVAEQKNNKKSARMPIPYLLSVLFQ